MNGYVTVHRFLCKFGVMKRFVLLAFVLVSWTSYVSATHILGGDITFKWKSDNVYTFYIDLYRDCSECKLSGRGGGSSTKDCGDFNVYLRSSSRKSCSSRELATLQPQFESYRKILPTCNSVRSTCDSNSNVSFGAEVHRYLVEIDFDDYKAYANCGFEVYVKLASRSDYLDNVTEQEALFFNYAYLDPVAHVSSPDFNEDPDLLLTSNSAIRHRLIRSASGWDSLLFKSVSPLRDFGKPLTYRTGYSPDQPITVYCASDPDCNPVPSNNPPIGYTLNTLTGEFRYTPVQVGERAVSAYAVEIYSEISGQTRLVGIIRRDIQQFVIEDYNNAPVISTSSSTANPFSFQVCEGTDLCFNVLAQDNPVQLPDGSSSVQDSVRFEVEFDSDSGRIQILNTNTPPYSSMRFCWRPDSSDAREEPYVLRVRAYDNHCPTNAYSERWIEIKVVNKPEVQIRQNKLVCGNVDVQAVTNQTGRINFYNWQVVDSIGSRFQGDPRSRDTLSFKKAGNYNLLLTVRNSAGCSESTSAPINWNQKDLVGPELIVTGNRSYCEGDSLLLELNSVEGYTTDSVKWSFGSDILSKEMILFETGVLRNRETRPLEINYFSNYSGLKCRNSAQIPIQIDTLPLIEIVEFPSFCPDGQAVDLLNFVSPRTGTFSKSTLNLIDGHIVDTRTIANKYIGSTHCVDYKLNSDRGFCTVVERLCVNALPIPELRMRDITSCSFGGNFLLNNMIVLPFQLNGYQVDWNVDNGNVQVSYSDDRYWLNLDSLKSGSYQVVCEIKNAGGCIAADTAWFHLLEQAVIEFSDPGIQCQREEIHLDEIFRVQPSGGGWNSFSYPEFLNKGILSSEVCGQEILLNYTYDHYGCFDTKNVTLIIQCAPEVCTNLNGDTICNSDLVALVAEPGDGVWSGTGVSHPNWNTDGLFGWDTILYSLNRDACTFNYPVAAYIVPRVSLQFDTLADYLCQGEPLELNGLKINGGTVELTHLGASYILDESAQSLKLNQSDSLTDWQLDLRLFTKSANCTSKRTIVIPVSAQARFQLDDSTLNGCEAFRLEPVPVHQSGEVNWNEVNFLWDFGVESDPRNIQRVANPSFIYRQEGSYVLNVQTTTQAGCVWNAMPYQISVHDKPEAYFVVEPGTYLSERNTLATFTNSSTSADSMNFLWDFGTSSGRRFSTQTSPRFVFPKDTGAYSVILTAQTENGCSDEFERTIIVGPDIRLFIPTAFTPNHLSPDLNEIHRVHGQYIKEYEIWIISRWGDIVYHSNDINSGWDGTYKGVPCETGVFAYKIKAKSLSNETYDFKGNITLLR